MDSRTWFYFGLDMEEGVKTIRGKLSSDCRPVLIFLITEKKPPVFAGISRGLPEWEL